MKNLVSVLLSLGGAIAGVTGAIAGAKGAFSTENPPLRVLPP